MNLTSPDGVLGYYTNWFRSEESFRSSCMVGPYETGKSKALIDFCLLRAVEYPGAHIGLVRSTLKDLKLSTVRDLVERGGNEIHAVNAAEGYYRISYQQTHPVTGAKVHSAISCLGTNKPIDDDWLGSTEFAYLAFEEADGINTEVRHKLTGRLRQKVYHKDRTILQFAQEMADKWGISSDEAAALLYASKGTNCYKLSVDHPLPALQQAKHVFNPKGQNDIWDEFVGLPFPYGGITPEWVKDNISVTEAHIASDTLIADRFEFGVGDIMQVSHAGETKRFYVGLQKDGEVSSISQIMPDMSVVENRIDFPIEVCTLVEQRATCYVFPYMNESRNKSTHRMSYLLPDKVRNKYILGKEFHEGDKRVFPDFNSDYMQHGGHVIPYMTDEHIQQVANLGIGGLDDGINHAMAGILSFVSKKSKSLIVFKEHVMRGMYAVENALEIRAMTPIWLNTTWGYDPAMDSRETSSFETPADIYRKELLNLIPGTSGEQSFGDANRLFKPKEITFKDALPFDMFIMENCEQTIEALSTLTWGMVRHKRADHRVDIGDAVKFMVSVRDKTLVDITPPKRRKLRPTMEKEDYAPNSNW